MAESKVPKSMNGTLKTVLTAVTVSAVITVASSVAAVEAIEANVLNLNQRVEEQSDIPSRVTKLETIAAERQRTNGEQLKQIRAELRDIKTALKSLGERRRR